MITFLKHMSSESSIASTVLAVAVLLGSIFLLLPKATPKLTMVPLRIFLEGIIVYQPIHAVGTLAKIRSFLRRYKFICITSCHRIIYDPDLAKTVLNKPRRLIGNSAVLWTFMKRSLAVEDDLLAKLAPGWDEMHSAVQQQMLQPRNLKVYTEAAVKHLQDCVPRLATFSLDATEMWEKDAGRKTLSPTAVEVNLPVLMRDLLANVTLSVLLGKEYLRDYPEALRDIRDFDDPFVFLIRGMPTWLPMPHIHKAISARSRIAEHLAALHDKIDAVTDGTADPTLAARIADVSQLATQRATALRELGINGIDRGKIELALVWGATSNTNLLSFWFLAYAIVIPHLLDELRKETAPFVTLSSGKIESIDVHGLTSKCPLTMSCFLETLRMTTVSLSIRNVVEGFSTTDPSTKETLHFRPGTFVTVPHVANHADPAVFPEPATFQPRRFIVQEPSEDGGVKYVVRPGALKPWGQGHGMCVGRQFAEREILVAVACLLQLWNFRMADGVTGLPGQQPAGGVVHPSSDFRVVVEPRLDR